jgi:putative ABC transport system permease protein
MNFLEIQVGYFLASRQIRRSSFWITSLIIFVMMTTFLNLVVVSGILVGLIAGSSNDFRSHYSGDILIKPKKENKVISNSKNIVEIADSLPHVTMISTRYLAPAQLEADYKTLKKGNEAKNIAPTILVGINPTNEDAVTHLSEFIVEGEYLDENDTDAVLVGSSLLKIP